MFRKRKSTGAKNEGHEHNKKIQESSNFEVIQEFLIFRNLKAEVELCTSLESNCSCVSAQFYPANWPRNSKKKNNI